MIILYIVLKVSCLVPTYPLHTTFTRLDDAHANLQLLFQIALVLEGLSGSMYVFGWKNIQHVHAFHMNIVYLYSRFVVRLHISYIHRYTICTKEKPKCSIL